MEEEVFSSEEAGSARAEKVFDEARALDVVDGDKGLLKEIIQIYLGEYMNDLEKIAEGIRRNDVCVVERAAHSLKGSLGNMGAGRAYEAAYRLERIGKEGRLEGAGEAMAVLRGELESLQKALSDYLEH